MGNEPEKIQRKEPWLAESAISLIAAYLGPQSTICEFGSGASTVWFSRYTNQLLSVEHDERWHKEAGQAVSEAGGRAMQIIKPRPYNTVIHRFPKTFFDLILVDGRDRVLCIESAIPHLKPGGWLVLDNSEREEYAAGIELMKDWNCIHCKQVRPDKYDFTYPNWTTSIFIKPN